MRAYCMPLRGGTESTEESLPRDRLESDLPRTAADFGEGYRLGLDVAEAARAPARKEQK